jgi:hypothetical protein
MVLAAHDELTAIEEECRSSIERIRADARDETARILQAAREQATAVHARAADLAGRGGQDSEPGGSPR